MVLSHFMHNASKTSTSTNYYNNSAYHKLIRLQKHPKPVFEQELTNNGQSPESKCHAHSKHQPVDAVWWSWVAVVSRTAAFYDRRTPRARWCGATGQILGTGPTAGHIWGIAPLVVDGLRWTGLSTCQCTCHTFWCSWWASYWFHIWLAVFCRIFTGAFVTTQRIYMENDKIVYSNQTWLFLFSKTGAGGRNCCTGDWVSGCGPLPKSLTLFMTQKIWYPIYDRCGW